MTVLRMIAGFLAAACLAAALTACAGTTRTGMAFAPVVSSSCSVGSNAAGRPEWTMVFTDTSSSPVTVGTYTVTFTDGNGHKAGSLTAADTPLSLSPGQQITDVEDQPILAPVPLGAQGCRLDQWYQPRSSP